MVVNGLYTGYLWSKGSCLFYNTSARLDWHECDTSATQRHESLKNFDLNNDTSENVLSYPYISYMANERLQGEEKIKKIFR